MELFYKAVILFSAFVVALGQESINVHEGLNVGMHAGIALVICFSILAGCAIGVNLVTRMCAKRLGMH